MRRASDPGVGSDERKRITTVRIGIKGYSARAARLFGEAEAEEIIQRCHALGLDWEILFNRLWMEEELEEMERKLRQIQAWDPAGIVYMDPAVVMAAETLGIQDRLVYAPDTLTTNAKDIRTMLELGVGRVVLAAEITLEEILDIAGKVEGAQLEVQIHGRQVMAYSRRPLVSNYVQVIGRTIEDLPKRRDLFI